MVSGNINSMRLSTVAVFATLFAGGLGSVAVHNSEEHKLLADRGASMVNQRSATLIHPTRFDVRTLTAAVRDYRSAKALAVGVPPYPTNADYVQDNSYWWGYGQRDGNLAIDLPGENGVPNVATRNLRVAAWTNESSGAPDEFTFGELVAIYGDYRRSVSCHPRDPNKCYLTHFDFGEYDNPSGNHYQAGMTYFEYANAWTVAAPNPRPTSEYLRYIGSGLLPPHATDLRAVENAAEPWEILDAGWWGDEMLRIALVNEWHFSQAAVAWYVGMHRLALYYAVLARGNPAYWTQALHYEANGLHSLTDLFAFGHIAVNRDETVSELRLLGTTGEPLTLRWMDAAVTMGGGKRTAGKVAFTSDFDALGPLPFVPRNDYFELCKTCSATKVIHEKTLHDNFNASGAVVINLKGEKFWIQGDGFIELVQTAPAGMVSAEQAAEETVRASVQSLFDAFESGATAEELASPGSESFAALMNIPIFVESEPNGWFLGQWTSYAAALDVVTGAGIVPEQSDCVMEYLDGDSSGPPALAGVVCTAFPRMLVTDDVVNDLLAGGECTGLVEVPGCSLSADDRRYLNLLGNSNGKYDVGDFAAWVEANGATPDSQSRTYVAKQLGGQQ